MDTEVRGSVVDPDEAALGALTHDAIAGDFRITQRSAGHRYSLDDVLTAFHAAKSGPRARRCLELGSGIGSVLLMLAYSLPEARFVAIEAQEVSFALLERNVHQNGLSSRVELVHGDLRTVATSDRFAPFDLITGTPPYVPPGRATPSPDSQKAHARQELRGGVEDYLAAMGRLLAPEGVAVICADARSPERVFTAAAQAGLAVVERRDAVPRAGKGALFTVFALARAPTRAPYRELDPFVARDAAGVRTADYHAVRAFFGMHPNLAEKSSP